MSTNGDIYGVLEFGGGGGGGGIVFIMSESAWPSPTHMFITRRVLHFVDHILCVYFLDSLQPLSKFPF